MDQSTLLWTVDATRGTVHFGRLMPFAGNTYELVFAGVVLEEVYTAYVMDESGLKCLAKSQHNAGAYTIAFNTADLRDEFERNMHEVKSFHVIVRDSKRVVAEGDLCVQWQSLWEDTTTGEVFTMRGPKGNPGTPGGKGDPGIRGMSAYDVAVKNGFDGSEEDWLKTLKGVPGSLTRVQKVDENGEETGKWHNVFVKLDQNRRLRIVIGKSEHEPDPSNDVYVSSLADMSVGGTKTFLESPIVPVITDANGEVDVTDDSGKAANTKWIRKWWTKIWEGILSSAHKFTAECTFENGITGNLKGNVEGTANKAIADKNGNKIDETYLQITGGTMKGAIVSQRKDIIKASGYDSYIELQGGTSGSTGAVLKLFGRDYKGAEGGAGGVEIQMVNADGSSAPALRCLPDGTLTWDGGHILRLVSSWKSTDGKSWYRKYSDGWCEQGGVLDYTKTGTKDFVETNLPVPMKDSNYTLILSLTHPNKAYTGGVEAEVFTASEVTSTSFTVLLATTQAGLNQKRWYACGFTAN